MNEQIAGVRVFHDHDVASGGGFAKLPMALRRKLDKSIRRFFWQFLFPSNQVSEDRGSRARLAPVRNWIYELEAALVPDENGFVLSQRVRGVNPTTGSGSCPPATWPG